ncbi:hypothetical protein NA57DRAFT_48977 [Rhizodiscina lignyota]|uniref:Beta-glucuronidase C-terminal domain-containing protein n=1 Tax=Rhizodiscina lignyota TaxID=1504668 RepID=A0A9P4I432_9PEZI|nr:hypothetical protein NA57DRAFT_48977 [Rhizodiscina lignyota]
MLSRLPFAVLSLSFAAISSAQNASEITLTPAAKGASVANLSQIVAPSFAGMGIEPTNLFSFLGYSQTNALSIQLFQNLADYSGVPPQLRIGGNAQDSMVYDSTVDSWGLVSNPHSTGQGNVPSDRNLFGNTYFKALNRLPTATPIVFGLNMAYNENDWVTRITTVAREVLKQVTTPTVISFEIGNEPDLYLGNGFRPPTYDGLDYTNEWLARAAAVANQVLTPNNYSSNYFEPGTTASTIGKTFAIALLMSDGINKTANGTHDTYIVGWNQHDYFYFVNVSVGGLTLDYLMDLDNTEAQFAYWASQVAIALGTGYPYYLREMGSAGPIGLQGISDTFGASLWTLNFFLYAAILNISSVDMHMTDNSWSAPWAPVERNGVAPYVRPSYYAWAVMAQLIGNCNGTARVAELDAGGNSNIRAYAFYAHGTFQSVVLINSIMVNASASDQDSVTFNLDLPDFKNQVLYLSTLTADGADSTSGTVWNGLTFSDKDGSPSGDMHAASTTVRIDSDGHASIRVRDSQAVVANLGWVLGSNAVVLPNSTDPRLSTANHKSDAKSNPTPTTAVIAGVTTTILASATSASQNPDPGPSTPSQKKGGAGSLMEWSRESLFLAAVAGMVGLGASHLLWRCW